MRIEQLPTNVCHIWFSSCHHIYTDTITKTIDVCRHDHGLKVLDDVTSMVYFPVKKAVIAIDVRYEN